MDELVSQNSTLPKISKTNTPALKYLLIILFVILPFVGFYLGMQYQKTIMQSNYDSSINIQKEETTYPSPTISTEQQIEPNLFSDQLISDSPFTNVTKLYLVVDTDNNENIVLTIPEGSTTNYSLSELGSMHLEANINKKGYGIAVPRGGAGAGACPNDDFETGKCGYKDEVVTTTPPLTIDTLRIWSDSRGVFLLNLIEITVGEHYMNNIQVRKENDTDSFSKEEITMWKNIFQTIAIEEKKF